MKLEVLFFSLLRPVVGGDSVSLELAEGTKVSELMPILIERFPALQDWQGKVRVAVDLEYVEEDFVLVEGQEIAIIPPVQGG